MKKRILPILFTITTILSSCGIQVKQEDLEYVVEKYTLLHPEMKLPNGNHVNDYYDYILLPYKLESKDGMYDYFQNEYAINITWEVIEGDLSFVTLNEDELENYKTADVIKPYVYGELYFVNENNLVNAFKVNYSSNSSGAKVKATYSCGDFSTTREYYIETIISASEKYFIDNNFYFYKGNDKYSKDSGGTFTANGSTLYRYSSTVNFKTNSVTSTYRNLSGTSNVTKYSFIYNIQDMSITVEDGLESIKFNLSESSEAYEVYEYRFSYFEKAFNEFITTLKLYDEVRTLFFDGENVSPYYGNQNYPSLSNFVITK